VTDDLHAPGNDRGIYWKAPLKYVRAGYSAKRIRLEGSDLEKAAQCRALHADMMAWYEGQPKSNRGTWRWIIGRYQRDEYSPYRDVKANTRKTYDVESAKLDRAIGDEAIADWNQPRIKMWHKGMIEAGRSVSYAHRQVTQLRIITNYGVQIESGPCDRIARILSKMKFPAPRPRQNAMTRDQMEAIVAAADRSGDTSFGTAVMLLFETSLRQADVRGLWVPGKGGINRHGKRWVDGLTWDMIEGDILRKITSKTGAEVAFDLSQIPALRARLMSITPKVGPVFVGRDGLPRSEKAFADTFAKYRAAAGVPKDVLLMDARAGAITEAKASGASPMDIRDMAGHSHLATTNRYMRGGEDATGRVIALRQGVAT